MMRLMTAFLLLLGLSAGGTALAGDTLRTYAPRFVRTLTVGPASIGEVESLVYGNTEYGFFETRELQPSGVKFTARIVPPGYRFPLAVYLKQRDATGAERLERFPDVGFSYPLTANEYAPALFAVDGSLSAPFFLGNAELTVAGKVALTSFIVNRQGEIVWLYGNQQDRSLGIPKPLGNGLYGFQTMKPGSFKLVSFDGTVHKQFSSGGGTIMHHDFLYRGGDELMTLGFRGFDFPGDPASVLKPDRYAVGRVLRVDLLTGKMDMLWDAFDDGPWLHGPGWDPKFHNSGPMAVGPEAPARQDYDHVNSIDWSPGRGYLLSLRNFSTVILLDETFRLRWSLGAAPGVTMVTKGTSAEFHRQHHATFLPNGDILLFDNGATRSRALQLRIDDNLHTFSLVREFLPDDPIHSRVRGSAFRLENGNTVVLFPGVPPTPGPSRIMEFDPQGKPVAVMTIPVQAMSHGYRAIPINAIGREAYLGSSPTH